MDPPERSSDVWLRSNYVFSNPVTVPLTDEAKIDQHGSGMTANASLT